MGKKPWEQGALRVSDNKKYLQNGEEPFFWLGDTAWLMLCGLSREEIAAYLENRAGKGYNVIQVTLAHQWPVKTLEGREAFFDGDFTKPDTEPGSYWETVDFAIKKAEELGLYMALLPIWSGQFKAGRLNLKNVEPYIDFLTERYGNYPNIIWITGGDCKGTDGSSVTGDDGFEFWSKMGRRLKAGTPEKLVTFHPFGRTVTSDYFPESEWIDFYMFQSGHRRYDQRSLKKWDDSATMGYYYGEDSYRYVERVEECGNRKPVLDGEPSYEHIPQGLHNPEEPFWQDYDVRRFAYWSVLAGGCGFTFGHSSIMQFYKGDGSEPGAYGCTINWEDAIHSPGSDNMAHMARLMRSVAWEKGKAAQELLACPDGEQYEHIAAFAGEDYALFYDYLGRDFSVRPGGIRGEKVKAYWFDPVSGQESYAGLRDNTKEMAFQTPKGGFSHTDWVLILKSV